MSPVVAGVRNHLFVQGALTLLFGLLRPGSTTAWTVGTVAVALAAVGLGAALKPTATMRTAVLGFEGVALAFGVVGLTQGHYVPGTIIGIHLLVKLFQTHGDDFTSTEPAHAMAPAPAAPAAWPPAPVAGAAPWASPQPTTDAVLQAEPDRPFSAHPPAPAPLPFLAPEPGAHPGGRTVVPVVPQQPAPHPVVPLPVGPQQATARPPAPLVPQQAVPVPEAQPVSALLAAPHAFGELPSVLEQAAQAVLEAPAPAVASAPPPLVPPSPGPPAPEPVPVVAPPTTAPQCMTILPG